MSEKSRSTDVRELAKAQFSEAFTSIKKSFEKTKFVLIVDTASIPLISSLFRTVELVEGNVVLLERYDLVRKPLIAYHAIYILSPAADLTALLDDFGSTQRYALAHILFTYPCAPDQVDKIKPMGGSIGSLKFLFVQFTPTDPLTFSSAVPTLFKSMYSTSPNRPPLAVTISHTVKSLISFFYSLKVVPEVAYAIATDPNSPTKACFELAESFKSQFQNAIDQYKLPVRGNGQTLLLIIPRGLDTISPLLHQFTYEAMLYEHKDVENETIQVNPQDPNSIVALNYYEDELFREIRYKPFHELGDVMDSRQLPFLQLENLQKNAPSPEARNEATKKLSRQKHEYDQVRNHFRLLADCNDLLEPRHLMMQSEYEQSLATGHGAGGAFKPSAPLLSQTLSKPGLDIVDKIRILALYWIKVGGGKATDLQRMMESARIDLEWKPAIESICAQLGKPLERTAEDVLQVKDRSGQPAMKTDKWIPLVYQLISNVLENRLDPKKFSVPPHEGRWQNIVLYVMGGISFMELRWLNEIRETKVKGAKLFVGSSCTITPKQFLAQAKALSA
jgi:hypothetical protein